MLQFEHIHTWPIYFSCLCVCQNWNHYVSQNSTLTDIIEDYKKQHHHKLPHTTPASLARPPIRVVLSAIPRNIQPIELARSHSTKSLPPLNTIPRNIKLQLCPNCHSPAKELNLRRVNCINPGCLFDYCKYCFKPWHKVSCMLDDESDHDRKRIGSINIAGNAKSRKRLRRLWYPGFHRLL